MICKGDSEDTLISCGDDGVIRFYNWKDGKTNVF